MTMNGNPGKCAKGKWRRETLEDVSNGPKGERSCKLKNGRVQMGGYGCQWAQTLTISVTGSLIRHERHWERGQENRHSPRASMP